MKKTTKAKKLSNQRRGPKPAITLAVARRVGERVGRGLTLEMALAAEQKVRINLETWKKALQTHEPFAIVYRAGQAAFAVSGTRRLAESKEPRRLAWLLVRRHPDRFCKPKPAVATSISAKHENKEARYEAAAWEIVIAPVVEKNAAEWRAKRARAWPARETEQEKGAGQNGHSTEAEHPTQKRGPKPAITLPVVKRVSVLVGRGVTLEQALAVEENAKINLETWKKALGTNKQFVAVYEGGQARFVDRATQCLAESKDLHWTEWLLERSQPETFCEPAAATRSSVNHEELEAKHVAAAVEKLLARFRECEAEEARQKAELEEQARETERQKGAGQNGNGHSPAASEDGKVESWKDGRMEKGEGRHEQPTQPEPATCTRWFGQPMPGTGPGQGPTGRAIIRPAVKTATDRVLESMGAYLV